ncbi:AzlD domain-containing protein [Gordonia soli]|uniref:Branched-chain amino acid transporter AzlD n=1 Tax=Gordonia soli NBRC 108243 TaxID=1223545 RepID=M0QQR8_9ACTN|nr:AzlD domain-containing protein [Gordonia soli]GAC70908.1 hypothetical protein GS4_43_00350 [Gordonia soli NBRC 108243]
MTVWILIAVLAASTLGMKMIGPALAGNWEPPPAALRVISLLGPALMAALVVSNTFVDGRMVVLDVRAAGLLVGLVALLVRLPMIVAALMAAVACAGVRLLIGI